MVSLIGSIGTSEPGIIPKIQTGVRVGPRVFVNRYLTDSSSDLSQSTEEVEEVLKIKISCKRNSEKLLLQNIIYEL